MTPEAKREDEIRQDWMKRAKETTPEMLSAFIKELSDYQHDYGTCVLAVGAAAIAAAHILSHHLGITGFQAGAVQWEFIEAWGVSEEGPKRLVSFSTMLYPQYEHSFEKTITPDTARWLQERATKMLKEKPKPHPEVYSHWKKLAAGELPFGYTIAER